MSPGAATAKVMFQQVPLVADEQDSMDRDHELPLTSIAIGCGNPPMITLLLTGAVMLVHLCALSNSWSKS